ncbi:hypothetical protein R3P38DRAFT_2552690, partial [Favolaschia claudopus]
MDPTKSSSTSPRYTSARQNCAAGYYFLATFDTSMTFELRQLPRITSRIVRIEDRVFELWSPNSAQRPFLPGERSPGFIAQPSRLLEDRRYDGHLGRFDCLYAPQYWVSALSHWPFMRHQPLVRTDDPAYVAYQPLTEGWVVNSTDARRGEFSTDFLRRLSALQSALAVRIETLRPRFTVNSGTWANRPRYASTLQVSMLSSVRSWQDAVDEGVAVQRGLREMEAWITMVEARRCLQPLTMNDLRNADMPLADDRFIGLWVNGLGEPAVLNYMYAGIPCFIAHEYPRNAVHRGIIDPNTRVFTDFMEGTELPRLLFDNPYQMIARESNLLNLGSRSEEGMGVHQQRDGAAEARSSSLLLQELPIHQTTSNPLPPVTSASSSAATASTPVARAPPAAAPGTASTSRSLASTKQDPSASSYAAREPETRVIASDRVPYIVPPPIQSADGKGWEKYQLSPAPDGSKAFIRRGSGHKTTGKTILYDRVRKRRLFMGSYIPPPGVVDYARFGAPAPRYPFLILDNDRSFPQKPSIWVYGTMTPAKGDKGRKAPAPSAVELPLRSATAKGKGKAPRSEEEEDDSEAEDAMDVDDEDENE